MEFYLYPPKYISYAALAALVPPAGRTPDEVQLYRASRPELSGEKQALHYVNAIQQALDARLPRSPAASPA
jgi:hypothetical protein